MEVFCLSFQLQLSYSNILTVNKLFKRDFLQAFLFAARGVEKEFSCVSLSSLEGKKLDILPFLSYSLYLAHAIGGKFQFREHAKS